MMTVVFLVILLRLLFLFLAKPHWLAPPYNAGWSAVEMFLPRS